jgi:hypothetical protein
VVLAYSEGIAAPETFVVSLVFHALLNNLIINYPNKNNDNTNSVDAVCIRPTAGNLCGQQPGFPWKRKEL